MLSADIDASARRGEPAAFSNDDARWEAVGRRDRSADGAFFCAVRTTGVYCRPSCAARPRRENVVFHATAAEAEQAGFRPCRRCRPGAAAPDPSRSQRIVARD
jgi:AraC family transcriptional regulator, regulatory protein of adaptative response / methylated-DNA-[protein]-cysteine methyltransferase